jgi:hypothetical protein
MVSSKGSLKYEFSEQIATGVPPPCREPQHPVRAEDLRFAIRFAIHDLYHP